MLFNGTVAWLGGGDKWSGGAVSEVGAPNFEADELCLINLGTPSPCLPVIFLTDSS